MSIGNIKVDTLKIGSLDLTNPKICQYISFNIYEDIFNPYGPSADILVNDFNDMITKLSIDGKEKIDISFSIEQGGSASYDLRSFELENLNDRSIDGQGSMKSKQYNIKAVSPELLVAEKKGEIQFSGSSELVSSMVGRLVKTEGFESSKPYICDDPTAYPDTVILSGHPIKIYKQLLDRSVSIINKSSYYTLFVSDQKYKYSTLEQLCRYPAKFNYKQSTTLSTSGKTFNDKFYSIIDILVNRTFFAPTRAKLTTKYKAYCIVTGKAVMPNFSPSEFVHLGYPYAQPLEGSTDKTQIEYHQHDRINNKNTTDQAAARANREAYKAHFEQNYAQITVPGNPNIKLGDVINIVIPKKSTYSDGEENQFNGPVLVTAIRHMIRPISEQPRYLTILKVSKAGGFD